MHPITLFKYITNWLSMSNLCYVHLWYPERDDQIVSAESSHPQEERVGGTIASPRV
jgi:hypothetical protein